MPDGLGRIKALIPEVEGKRLMVLGAGRGQVGLIKTAKLMGCTVIVATKTLDFPGVEYADEIAIVDLKDREGVLAAAEQFNVDGIATSCNDVGLPAQGYVNQKLKLSGVGEAAAEACGDKYKMKCRLAENAVPTARFTLVRSKEEALAALNALPMPVVVKATDLQGSRGVFICKDRGQVTESFSKTMAITNKDYCIIEEFVEGDVFGAEAFVQDGEVLFVHPHGNYTVRTSTDVPVGHYAPLFWATEIEDKLIREAVEGAIEAVGLDNCAVNVDLIMKKGRPYVVELTGRTGANCLPELTGLHLGVDYYKMIVLVALGMDVKSYFSNRAEGAPCVAARMLTLQQSGIVSEVSIPDYDGDTRVREISVFVQPGDEVRKFRNSNDCVAQVIVAGQTLEECEMSIDQVLEDLKVVCA